MFNQKKKAFTLIELLVVIAIIGILATLAVVALQQARSRARDSKRLADIKQLHTSLDLFYNQYNRYPTIEEWDSGAIGTTGEIFMIKIPKAPSVADGDCNEEENSYIYLPSDDNSSYQISFCVGKEVSSLSAGSLCLNPGGIENKSCIAPVCTEWTYSDWGECMIGGEQSREIISSSPENCEGGDPILNQSCEYVPLCSEYLNESICKYDGYIYQIIKIGNQTWFAENLRTTKYRDGSDINYPGSNNDAWRYTTEGAYACYNNNLTNCNTYGVLYNRYAAHDSRGVCPQGWSVPTSTQFENLRDYLYSQSVYGCDDGYGYDYRRLAKALASTSYWIGSSYRCLPGNSRSTNNSVGFNILPAGRRSPDGTFSDINNDGRFYTTSTSYSWGVGNGYGAFLSRTSSSGSPEIGWSIRCIKN